MGADVQGRFLRRKCAHRLDQPPLVGTNLKCTGGLSWSDPAQAHPAQAPTPRKPCPLAAVRGAFGDPMAQILVQVRRRKQRHVASVDGGSAVSTTGDAGWRGTCRAPIFASTWTWKSGASRAGVVGR